MSEPATVYCVNHPQRETLVRCSKCEAPICTSCRVETPVGFRCRQCGIYTPVQYQVPWFLYGPALAMGLTAGAIGGIVGSHLGFFNFFVGPIIGTMVGELVARVARGKRGKRLAGIAAVCVVLGALAAPVLTSRELLAAAGQLFSPSFWIYVVMAVPAAFWRLR